MNLKLMGKFRVKKPYCPICLSFDLIKRRRKHWTPMGNNTGVTYVCKKCSFELSYVQLKSESGRKENDRKTH